MNSTRPLSRSFSCSTISFLSAASSPASEPDHGHPPRRKGDAEDAGSEFEHATVDSRRWNRNSSLSLRRMSTFARFLRKSTSSGSRHEGQKLHKAGKTKSMCGPEWVSSPRDYTSCTLCDRFFVSGEDWLEVCTRHIAVAAHFFITNFDYSLWFSTTDGVLKSASEPSRSGW